MGIGSLTNLYGAMLLDSGIFDKLGQVVLMGGITETLYTHGKHCPELNFSINHKAAAAVLSRGKKISILTGNNCLPVSYLPKTEFMEHMQVESSRVGAYIAKNAATALTRARPSMGRKAPTAGTRSQRPTCSIPSCLRMSRSAAPSRRSSCAPAFKPEQAGRHRSQPPARKGRSRLPPKSL